MNFKKNASLALACSALVFISACSSSNERMGHPQVGTLSRTLEMVDQEGRHYGRVELDPVGGGKVFDSNGRLIGDIVVPVR